MEDGADFFGNFQSQGDEPIRIRNIVETRRKQAASLIQSYDEQMKKSMGKRPSRRTKMPQSKLGARARAKL